MQFEFGAEEPHDTLHPQTAVHVRSLWPSAFVFNILSLKLIEQIALTSPNNTEMMSREIPLPGFNLKRWKSVGRRQEEENREGSGASIQSWSVGPAVPSHSEAADVWETLELLWEVVFIEHRVRTVLHHLQRHCAEHRRKLVNALGSEDAEHKSVTNRFSTESYFNASWVIWWAISLLDSVWVIISNCS